MAVNIRAGGGVGGDGDGVGGVDGIVVSIIPVLLVENAGFDIGTAQALPVRIPLIL
jgi:hypothetical protein